MRIAVLGYLVRGPLGGLSWHPVQYATGLANLGHEVVFLEDSGDDRWCCYDPSRGVTDENPEYGLRFAGEFLSRVGLEDRWAYFDAHTNRWCGPLGSEAPNWIRTAEIVVNVSGVTILRHGLESAPVRIYVDTDPGFTQVRNLQEEDGRALALAHNRFFSFGENTASLPEDGFSWQPTRQPVDLRYWPPRPAPARGPFTSSLQWESYPPRMYNGRRLGMKSDSFPGYQDLPRKAGVEIEWAIGGPNAPRQMLIENGWRLSDPQEVLRNPWDFQKYLSASKAEFSLAKHGYVVTECGWFSDRSAAYLATGRPVVTQDTGFGRWLRTSGGVLAFRTPEEAVDAIQEVEGNYELHQRLARQVAEEYFDARKVLTSLLDRALTDKL